MPIGSNGNRFRDNATFDGKGYTISNLTITDGNNDYAGLFGAIKDASIGNLKLATVDIDGGSNVGALVGSATGTTTLSNIELIGDEFAKQESCRNNGKWIKCWRIGR